jgi:hypothetical protein
MAFCINSGTTVHYKRQEEHHVYIGSRNGIV